MLDLLVLSTSIMTDVCPQTEYMKTRARINGYCVLPL